MSSTIDPQAAALGEQLLTVLNAAGDIPVRVVIIAFAAALGQVAASIDELPEVQGDGDRFIENVATGAGMLLDDRRKARADALLVKPLVKNARKRVKRMIDATKGGYSK